ncbi:MAG: VCBS repeat-containing protein [Candidatus Eisenbacteria bacterium]|nr:VCBS repeat-containing protein [Candidatus Eisenbacteria bacterium]
MARTAMAMTVAAALMVAGCGAATATTVYWTPAHELAPPGWRLDFMTWGDLDGDGDDDVCAFAQYWNDGGCPGPPVWRVASCVLPGLWEYIELSSTLGDLDADGDLDVIRGCREPALLMFWNIGTPHVPQWQYDPSVFGPGGDTVMCPCLTDLDGDGDLDIVMVGAGGGVWFCENTGTPTAPQFSYGGCTSIPLGVQPPFAFITVGDLDGDGDLDIITITTDDTPSRCWENIGTPEEWLFAENPAMLTGVTEPARGFGIALPDIDCDGDPDLLIVDGHGGVYLYMNETVTSASPATWGTIKALYR